MMFNRPTYCGMGASTIINCVKSSFQAAENMHEHQEKQKLMLGDCRH